MKRKYVINPDFFKTQLERFYDSNYTYEEDFLIEQRDGFILVEAVTQRGRQVLYSYENHNLMTGGLI